MKAGRPFLDTSVVLYAFHDGELRQDRARGLIASGDGVISVQTLNEFTRVARQKLRREWKEIRRALAAIRNSCAAVAPVTLETHDRGLAIAEQRGYRVSDALLLAAAIEASCDAFYSEDMRHGQRIEGLVILNPFRGAL